MAKFVVLTESGTRIVKANTRKLALTGIDNFISVAEFDVTAQKICPDHENCDCGIMPMSHNFCHKCGKALIQ